MAERTRVNGTSQPIEEETPLNKRVPTIDELLDQLEELDRRITALEEAQR